VTPLLTLENLTKTYAPGHPPVVDDLTLTADAGELVALLGPSGCGKTTTLRLIAGLERPDAGRVVIDGIETAGPGRFLQPEKRGVGLVFQDYALFPHLTVLQNVMFGLSGRGRTERAREVLNLVGLTVFEKRYPHQLSGGQQQRVALARALAPRPRLVLLDEPFSSLDAALRHATRAEVRAILREAHATAILVTHDQDEALAFSDRVIVMRAGRIEQAGPPEIVYRQPATAFVASFLGRSNLLRGTGQGQQAATALGLIPLATPAHGPVLVSLRPEDLRFSSDGVPAVIVRREYKGHDTTYTVRAGNMELHVHSTDDHVLTEGMHVHLTVHGAARPVH